MRKGYTRLQDIQAKHNELHRLCFLTPYLVREVTSTPTTDQLEEKEFVYNSTDHKVYTKIDGVIKSIGDANVAGSDGQIQYNNNGVFGGSEIEYDDSTKETTFPDEVILKAGKKIIFDG